MREHELPRRQLHIGSPVQRGVQHLPQEFELVVAQVADLDRHDRAYLLPMAGETPRFFRSAAEWRKWLEKNHANADELWVGYHKKATGKPSMTWAESVDEALCFGWIDGLRKSLGDESYKIRFTPRRPGSNWSLVNTKRVEELTEQGLMRPAGTAAFAARKSEGNYSYEQRHEAAFTPEQERRFRANKPAWKFFQEQPAGYRQLATWWVISAKRDETRERRLVKIIEDSAAARRAAW